MPIDLFASQAPAAAAPRDLFAAEAPVAASPQSQIPRTQTPSAGDNLVKAASKIPGATALADKISPVTGAIVSTVGGIKQGLADSVEQTGKLAGDILNWAGAEKLAGKVKSLATSGKEAVQKTVNPTDIMAGSEHPNYQTGGRIAGAIAGNIGLQAGPLGGAAGMVGKGLGQVVPTLAKSPVLAGIASNAVVGAGLGAAQNEENRLGGAVLGGALGGAAGAIGGAIGHKLKRAGDIVEFETGNIRAAGVNPASYEGVSRIIKSVKDQGMDMSKQHVQRQISDGIGSLILKSGPLDDLNVAPAEAIANLAKTSYTSVTEKINALKAPFTSLTQPVPASNYTKAISNPELPILSSRLKSALPKVSDDLTFDKLWTKRQELDGVIHTARAKAATDVIYKRSLPGLMQARQGLTDDLTSAASTLGLKDQWASLNKMYQTELFPFQAFRTASGKVISEDDVVDSMKKLNTLLNPRVSPNIRDLNLVAKSLGTDGQQVVGQAMLHNMYKRSLNDKGLVDPKSFFTQLKKTSTSGIDSKVWSLETRQAATGIKEILDGADEAMKLGSQFDPTSLLSKVSSVIPSLLSTRGGIVFLKALGTSGESRTTIRGMLQKLFTGITTTSANGESSEQ